MQLAVANVLKEKVLLLTHKKNHPFPVSIYSPFYLILIKI